MSKKRKTLGLALGSGGARGACHIGILKALVENNIPVDFLSGSSMGAVLGGGFACGADLDEMEKALRELKQLDLIDFNLFPLTKMGFLRGENARKIIEKFITNDNAEKTNIPFSCVAVDIKKGRLDILNKGSLIKNIRASMSIPVIFEPVAIDDSLYIDGGVMCRIPIEAVRMMKPDVVIGVDALGQIFEKDDIKNIFDIIFRTFDIMDWENAKRIMHSADLVITPHIAEANQYSAKFVPTAIDAGYIAGLNAIPKIKELLGL